MKYILMMTGTKADFDWYAKWSKQDLQAHFAFRWQAEAREDRWRRALPLTNEIIRLWSDQFKPARLTLGQAFENYPLMTYALAKAEGHLEAVTSLYGSMMMTSSKTFERVVGRPERALALNRR